MSTLPREAVGDRYDRDVLRRAQRRGWAVLHEIAAGMHPGIDEDGAQCLAERVFAAHAVERLWHPPLIRIGPNTARTFREPSRADVRLGGNDSFFIDLGLVFEGHEADVGDTFTVGDAPERRACAEAAREVFAAAAAAWRAQDLSGEALYALAAARAAALGWQLHPDIRGHRIGDFPHAVHKGGSLGTVVQTPAAARWILEIQLLAPDRSHGAFYENLLDESAAVSPAAGA